MCFMLSKDTYMGLWVLCGCVTITEELHMQLAHLTLGPEMRIYIHVLPLRIIGYIELFSKTPVLSINSLYFKVFAGTCQATVLAMTLLFLLVASRRRCDFL